MATLNNNETPMTLSQQPSHNGHETNGELASRNLQIEIERLGEMRWMIEKAGGSLPAYDQGIAQLNITLHGIKESAKQ